jgi:hypothetical protein
MKGLHGLTVKRISLAGVPGRKMKNDQLLHFRFSPQDTGLIGGKVVTVGGFFPVGL